MKLLKDLVTKWHKSKTIIFNLAAIGLVALEGNLNIIKENFNVNVFLVLSVAVPMVNFYLRTITTKPLSDKETINDK